MHGSYSLSPAAPFLDGLTEQVELLPPTGPSVPIGPAGSSEEPGPVPMTRLTRGADRSNPLRRFLRTETASAGLVLVSVVAALVWASVATAGYAGFWEGPIAVRLGDWVGTVTARDVVNQGLMTAFFLVVGLEARREFDLGALRERRKAAVPLMLGVAGMLVPVGIYLAVTHGSAGASGWGAAMSTDTALSLGALTVLGRSMPARVRTFLLTVLVVDDIAALLVIAVVYSRPPQLTPLAVAAAAYATLLATRRLPFQQRRTAYAVSGIVIWGGLLTAGVDPVVAGLLIGLATSAETPSRGSLEEATTLVRRFRERPMPELASAARTGLIASLSANTRLQYAFHPWASRVVVPLFALANAGVPLTPASLAHALRSPIGLGIALAYVVGKPLAMTGGSWLVGRASRGSLHPQVGLGAVAGSGVTAGIGLTVSLLVADLAFTGADLRDAKIGLLAAAFTAGLLSSAAFRLLAALPEPLRARAVHGSDRDPIDLVEPVDPRTDHVLGTRTPLVTIVEYGDFECPWTAMASPTSQEILAANPDVRYVWRHLPLTDVHPHAEIAAEAAEAAGAQGRYWSMHHALLADQGAFELEDLLSHASRLGLDLGRFRTDLTSHRHALRVARDIDSADASGVAGTPTFFINGRRHDGPPDIATLTGAIAEARTRLLAVEGELAQAS
ncbi:MAG TPA: Na+/H+ antiporter NhaA [Nocardioides sp.]